MPMIAGEGSDEGEKRRPGEGETLFQG